VSAANASAVPRYAPQLRGGFEAMSTWQSRRQLRRLRSAHRSDRRPGVPFLGNSTVAQFYVIPPQLFEGASIASPEFATNPWRIPSCHLLPPVSYFDRTRQSGTPFEPRPLGEILFISQSGLAPPVAANQFRQPVRHKARRCLCLDLRRKGGIFRGTAIVRTLSRRDASNQSIPRLIAFRLLDKVQTREHADHRRRLHAESRSSWERRGR